MQSFHLLNGVLCDQKMHECWRNLQFPAMNNHRPNNLNVLNPHMLSELPLPTACFGSGRVRSSSEKSCWDHHEQSDQTAGVHWSTQFAMVAWTPQTTPTKEWIGKCVWSTKQDNTMKQQNSHDKQISSKTMVQTTCQWQHLSLTQPDHQWDICSPTNYAPICLIT